MGLRKSNKGFLHTVEAILAVILLLAYIGYFYEPYTKINIPEKDNLKSLKMITLANSIENVDALNNELLYGSGKTFSAILSDLYGAGNKFFVRTENIEPRIIKGMFLLNESRIRDVYFLKEVNCSDVLNFFISDSEELICYENSSYFSFPLLSMIIKSNTGTKTELYIDENGDGYDFDELVLDKTVKNISSNDYFFEGIYNRGRKARFWLLKNNDKYYFGNLTGRIYNGKDVEISLAPNTLYYGKFYDFVILSNKTYLDNFNFDTINDLVAEGTTFIEINSLSQLDPDRRDIYGVENVSYSAIGSSNYVTFSESYRDDELEFLNNLQKTRRFELNTGPSGLLPSQVPPGENESYVKLVEIFDNIGSFKIIIGNKTDGKYDHIYLDSNGDGNFSDGDDKFPIHKGGTISPYSSTDHPSVYQFYDSDEFQGSNITLKVWEPYFYDASQTPDNKLYPKNNETERVIAYYTNSDYCIVCSRDIGNEIYTEFSTYNTPIGKGTLILDSQHTYDFTANVSSQELIIDLNNDGYEGVSPNEGPLMLFALVKTYPEIYKIMKINNTGVKFRLEDRLKRPYIVLNKRGKAGSTLLVNSDKMPDFNLLQDVIVWGVKREEVLQESTFDNIQIETAKTIMTLDNDFYQPYILELRG